MIRLPTGSDIGDPQASPLAVIGQKSPRIQSVAPTRPRYHAPRSIAAYNEAVNQVIQAGIRRDSLVGMLPGNENNQEKEGIRQALITFATNVATRENIRRSTPPRTGTGTGGIVSSEVRAALRRLGRAPGLIPAICAAAAVILLSAGCGDEAPRTADVTTAVPDACGLVAEDFLVSLLGERPAPPRSEGDGTSPRRGCTWLAPSAEKARASLIINVTGGGPGGDPDEKSRMESARRLFEKHTLNGESCEYFDGSGYQACWSSHRTSTLVVILKDGLVVSATVSSLDRKDTERDEAIKNSRALADHVVGHL